MQTKLTLRIDDTLIEKAKKHSKESGKSVSQIVADYFALLNMTDHHKNSKKLPPATKHLHGILKNKNKVSESDYYKHLEDKYL
jgi:hypothetical protein